jgi:hypothetical protein
MTRETWFGLILGAAIVAFVLTIGSLIRGATMPPPPHVGDIRGELR